jgi:hypothetical protein
MGICGNLLDIIQVTVEGSINNSNFTTHAFRLFCSVEVDSDAKRVLISWSFCWI